MLTQHAARLISIIERGAAICLMKDEPYLETGLRKRQTYPLVGRQFDGGLNLKRVDITDGPCLVEIRILLHLNGCTEGIVRGSVAELYGYYLAWTRQAG